MQSFVQRATRIHSLGLVPNDAHSGERESVSSHSLSNGDTVNHHHQRHFASYLDYKVSSTKRTWRTANPRARARQNPHVFRLRRTCNRRHAAILRCLPTPTIKDKRLQFSNLFWDKCISQQVSLVLSENYSVRCIEEIRWWKEKWQTRRIIVKDIFWELRDFYKG